jgi:citrate synthase
MEEDSGRPQSGSVCVTIAQDFSNHLFADARMMGWIRHHREFCNEPHL